MKTNNKISNIFLVLILILHFQYLKHTSASRIHSRTLKNGISPKNRHDQNIEKYI